MVVRARTIHHKAIHIMPGIDNRHTRTGRTMNRVSKRECLSGVIVGEGGLEGSDSGLSVVMNFIVNTLACA